MKFKMYSMVLAIIFTFGLNAQSDDFKKELSGKEKIQIQEVFKDMSESDQKYRGYLTYNTLEDSIIDRIDELYEEKGFEEAMAYHQSLKLTLPQEVKDSLWRLQSQIDLQNHLIFSGFIHEYGYPSDTLMGEYDYIPMILLMHPPAEWDVESYLEMYSELLYDEVKSKRMPPKTYAMFVDNINAKILRRPQIYGTNQQFDVKTNKVLPPIITNLEKSNRAREDIGLPQLKEGEYRISESE